MMGLITSYTHYIGGNMESLLKRITDKAVEKGYGFRLDAYEMWNYGCYDFVSDYHTSYEKLVEDFDGVETETISFGKLDGYIPLKKRLKKHGFDAVKDMSADDSDLAYDLLCGDNYTRWINWGGNIGTDCLNDGDCELWDILEIDKITEEYEKELQTFERF